MGNNLKILVLAGGISEEREVSLSSAKAITEALLRLGHNIKVIDAASGLSLLGRDGRYILEPDTESSSKIAFKERSSQALTESVNSDSFKDVDVIFLALHGGAGEDGTIQALLELSGKRYTGSGILASAAAMDKAFSKRLLANEGVPTPDWLLLKLKSEEQIPEHLSAIRERFTPPLIVKPNDSGSTVGLTLVKDFSELETAIRNAFGKSKNVLIEQYIRGREITISVLDGRALPPVEIIPTNEVYDYECKYTKGKSTYVCPADMPEEVAVKIQELAVRAYEIIGCSGLARADFIMDSGFNPYFLEVNTLPGMTELSLAPMAAKQAGITFEQLVQRICETALEK